MVPVRDLDGRSRPLPTPPWLRFGYSIEFDSAGSWRGLKIDFEAIALHLRALRSAAAERGLAIDRVILDPELQPLLFAVDPGLRGSLAFSRSRSWVRHDEHYHVDFGRP